MKTICQYCGEEIVKGERFVLLSYGITGQKTKFKLTDFDAFHHRCGIMVREMEK